MEYVAHLALYVYSHGVREFERVEESVGDDRGAGVGAGDLHEFADHLWSEHAAVLVAQMDGPRVLGHRRARLDPHVKLSCNKVMQYTFLVC